MKYHIIYKGKKHKKIDVIEAYNQQDAIKIAQNNITAVDKVTAQQIQKQKKKDWFIHHNCPKCGHPCRERTSRMGNKSWLCTNYSCQGYFTQDGKYRFKFDSMYMQ